jgi:hypothetical protein
LIPRRRALSESPGTGWISLSLRAQQIEGWILLLGGVQLLMIGVLGEYLSRVYDEVKGRPLYIVAEEVGGEGLGDDTAMV